MLQHLHFRLFVTAALGATLFAGASAQAAAPSAREVRERIDAVSKLLASGKPDEAVAALAAGIAGLEAMRAEPKPPPGFKLLADRAATARRVLDKAGVDVTMLEVPAFAPPAGGGRTGAGQVQPGSGVSFARQVAPLLVRSCGGCHVSGRRGDFQMASYDALMRTGMVQRGVGNASRLVEVIVSGDMPRGGGRVSADELALLVAWINAGASCDADPTAGLEAVARGTAAVPAAAPPAGPPQRLPGPQFAAVRFAAAEKLWARMLPDEQPIVTVREELCLIGNLPPARLDGLAAEAVEVAGLVARELGTDAGSPLQGGIVVYAFRNAFDYSALWQVVMNGERPRGLSGHAGTSGDVVYGGFIVPAAEETGDARLLLAEQIAAAALSGRGLPAWFCSGAGRAVAMKLAPKAALAQTWKREAGAAVARLGSAQDFLAGHADRAATSLAAGGFVSSLATAGKLAQIVALVDGGGSFDEAFAKVFRSPPQQAFTAWAARNAGR